MPIDRLLRAAAWFCACLSGLGFFLIGAEAAPERYEMSLMQAEIHFIAERETALYALPDPFPFAETIQIETNGAPLVKEIDYSYRRATNAVAFTPPLPVGTAVRIRYRRLAWDAPRRYARRIFELPEETPAWEPPARPKAETAPFDPSLLQVSGAKTFGLSAGNRRSFAPDQSLFLNLDGEILPGVMVSAALTDQRLPFQPDGASEQISQLDQTRIQLRSESIEAAVGDGELSLRGPELALFRRAMLGMRASGTFSGFNLQAAAALPKGHSDSVVLAAEEGRSEYRIAPRDRYVVMIAGSEKVWLNGERMKRGENNDYVIRDYGDPVVEFTPRRLLTRNDIIRVDYEYAPEDEGWSRSLYAGRVGAPLQFNMSRGSGEAGVTYAVESDDRSRPLAPLTEADMEALRRGETQTADGKQLNPPTQRQIAAFDAVLNPTQFLRLRGEWAMQRFNPNTLARSSAHESSGAWRFETSADAGWIQAFGEGERLGRGYLPIGATNRSRRGGARYAQAFAEGWSGGGFGDARLGGTLSAPPSLEPPEETRWNGRVNAEPLNGLTLRGNVGRTAERHADAVYDADRRQLGGGAIFQRNGLPELRLQRRQSAESGSHQKAENDWTLAHEMSGVRAEYAGRRFLSEQLADEAVEGGYDRNLTQRADVYSVSAGFASARFETERETRRSSEGVWIPSSRAETYRLDMRRRHLSASFGRRILRLLDGSSDSADASYIAQLDGNAAPFQGALDLGAHFEIDKRLSSKREEIFTNIIEVNGTAVPLLPGQGTHVKVDEQRYVEDAEEGDHVRLVRTVGDQPVGALEAQLRGRLDPSRLFRGSEESAGGFLQAALRAVSCSARWSAEEEQEDASFQELLQWKNFRGARTAYGRRSAQFRASIQAEPQEGKPVLADASFTDMETLNRRFNNETRRTESAATRLRGVWTLSKRWSLEGETERRRSRRIVEGESNLRRLERLTAAGARYAQDRTWTIGLRLDRKTESASEARVGLPMEDASGSSLTRGAELSGSWHSFGKGRAELTFRLANGSSAGELPSLSAFRFYEGWSREARAQGEYRVRSWTDLTFRANYRMLDADGRPTEHRFDLELTAEL